LCLTKPLPGFMRASTCLLVMHGNTPLEMLRQIWPLWGTGPGCSNVDEKGRKEKDVQATKTIPCTEGQKFSPYWWYGQPLLDSTSPFLLCHQVLWRHRAHLTHFSDQHWAKTSLDVQSPLEHLWWNDKFKKHVF
jgi:hypothetical protein